MWFPLSQWRLFWVWQPCRSSTAVRTSWNRYLRWGGQAISVSLLRFIASGLKGSAFFFLSLSWKPTDSHKQGIEDVQWVESKYCVGDGQRRRSIETSLKQKPRAVSTQVSCCVPVHKSPFYLHTFNTMRCNASRLYGNYNWEQHATLSLGRSSNGKETLNLFG